MGDDILAPHAEELPTFEFLEETELFDMVVGVSLDKPVAQSDELNGGLSEVERDALGTQGVVTLFVSIVVLADCQVIGVART